MQKREYPLGGEGSPRQRRLRKDREYSTVGQSPEPVESDEAVLEEDRDAAGLEVDTSITSNLALRPKQTFLSIQKAFVNGARQKPSNPTAEYLLT